MLCQRLCLTPLMDPYHSVQRRYHHHHSTPKPPSPPPPVRQNPSSPSLPSPAPFRTEHQDASLKRKAQRVFAHYCVTGEAAPQVIAGALSEYKFLRLCKESGLFTVPYGQTNGYDKTRAQIAFRQCLKKEVPVKAPYGPYIRNRTEVFPESFYSHRLRIVGRTWPRPPLLHPRGRGDSPGRYLE